MAKRPNESLRLAVIAEMRWRAESKGCQGSHDGVCCDPDLEIHPEDWCDECLMGTMAQWNEPSWPAVIQAAVDKQL